MWDVCMCGRIIVRPIVALQCGDERSAQEGGMTFLVEIEQEEDGRWIAEVVDLPGVLAYGTTLGEAKAKVQALALRVVADRLEHGEAGPDLLNISFAAA